MRQSTATKIDFEVYDSKTGKAITSDSGDENVKRFELLAAEALRLRNEALDHIVVAAKTHAETTIPETMGDMLKKHGYTDPEFKTNGFPEWKKALEAALKRQCNKCF